MRLLRHLFDFDREESPGEVIFYKLFEAFIVATSMVLAWQWAVYTLRLSEAVVPQGIGRVVDIGFMYQGPLPVIGAACATALLAAGYLRWSRFSYFGAFVVMHLLFAARFSLGKIPHGSYMIGMTLLGFALAVAAFRNPSHRHRFTWGFIYFFVGLGYVLAGFSKLVGTGPTWPDGRHLRLWVYEKSIDNLARLGSFDLNVLQEVVLNHWGIGTAMLAFGLVAELSAWGIWFRKMRTAVLLVLVSMHLGIYLVMNISFTLSVYELLLLALPWAAWLENARTRQSWMQPLERFSYRYA